MHYYLVYHIGDLLDKSFCRVTYTSTISAIERTGRDQYLCDTEQTRETLIESEAEYTDDANISIEI